MGWCGGGEEGGSGVGWHSEGRTPKNEALLEAVVKQVRTTGHGCLTACDTNMCPEEFWKSFGSMADTCSLRRQKEAFQPVDPKAQMAK